MTRLAVKGCGMLTAVGYNAAASCAAIRARISGARTDNIWDPRSGQYLDVCRPHTPQWWEGPDMLAELAAPSVLECLAGLPAQVPRETVPLLLLLSAPDQPGRPTGLADIVLRELKRRLPFESSHPIKVLEHGRTGIIEALRLSADFLTSGKAVNTLVVGVDTLLRQRVVDAYNDRRRVLTPNNSNGFIPGEAACCVLIAAEGQQAGDELVIVGQGQARESGTIDSDQPLTGDGITDALRGALDQAGLKMADTDYWLTDQNAEHYKAKECTIAQIRLERRSHPAPTPYQIWHPIDCIGEIGSAISPALMGVGYMAAKNGYVPGSTALMHVGEDNGERGALVLHWSKARV